jgi:hypothetical protein
MTDSLFNKLNDQSVLNAVRAPPPIPDTVTSFLGRLFLLHGVPFHYLLPHEKLLEPESLKFFYIDREWVAALINGALSVGHEEVTKDYLEKAMTTEPAYIKEACQIRKRARPETEISTGNENEPEDAPKSQRYTGFVLRSRLLAGWPGIEIRAFQGERQLRILRLNRVDRVDPVVLFGLVDGELNKLDIAQPPEGLHFTLEGTPEAELSESANKKSIWRGQAEESGVLDVRNLREALQLHDGGGAEFAKKIIAQQLRGVFELKAES